ncbi:zinc-binding dehydrogenase [Virgibacillus sp. MG-45]|uniref:zinc-binding dehydrogenase n=1 Tax=Virgibacillus sp. MG-45 TaxID=3102791 RepID=UPI002ED81A4A
MKAFVIDQGTFKLKEMEDPVPSKGEVIVSIKTAGLNHRDLFIPDRLSKDHSPLIIGSDGAGMIETVGEGVQHVKCGDEVIINPSLRWFQQSDFPPKEFDILGMPDNGTFAEKIVLSADQVEAKPKHLSWEEAGVLALSGLTGYRAMFTKGKLKSGETVFIPGAGSGVATILILLAKCIGARVIVTSRSKAKLDKAKKLGADVVIKTASDWPAILKNEKIDLVIDSVGNATFRRSLEVLRKGGRMVVFGSSTGDEVTFDLRTFFYGQYELHGTTMGSREELQAFLSLVSKYHIHPVVDHTFPLKDAADAWNYLKDGKQFGKLALTVTSV